MKHICTTAQLGAFIVLIASYSAFAAPTTVAGKVTVAIGQTRAVDKDGQLRVLSKGDGVTAGDHLLTTDGRLQVRFSDGGLVALQPHTEFAIDDYNFNSGQAEKAAEIERSMFNLLKGGIRVATGLIGRRNRDSYKLRTQFATIGIRGTTFKARICKGDCAVADGLYAKGGEGSIVVKNEVGELELTVGQNAYVSAPNQTPARTDIEPDLSDIPPVSADYATATSNPTGPITDTNFIGGQAVFQASISGVTDNRDLRVAAGAASGTIAFSGKGEIGGVNFNGDTKSGSFQESGHFTDSGLTSMQGAFNDKDGMIGFSGTDENGDSAAVFVTNVKEAQSDGILYLGRWTEASLTAFATGGFSATADLTNKDNAHYITAENEITLPKSGSASYDFNGMATSSTGTDGSIGKGLTAGRVDVSFGTGAVDTNLTIDHEGLINVHSSGDLNGDGPSFDTDDGFASGAGCKPSCEVTVDGFVAGPKGGSPDRVGLSYEILQDQRGIVGVGGFSRIGAP